MKHFVFLSLFAYCLSGCVQRYTPPHPKPPISTEWKQKQEVEPPVFQCPEASITCQTVHFRPWWIIFNDPALNVFEEEAVINSPSVADAVARLNEARALYGIARSALFPELDLALEGSRSKLSKSEVGQAATAVNPSCNISPNLGPSPLNPKSGTMFQVPLPDPTPAPTPACPTPASPPLHISNLAILAEVSYEFDFWGKNLQNTEAALKRVEAQEDDLESALLILTTNVAATYLNLRSFDAEIQVLEDTQKSRQHSYDLQKSRYDAGLIDELDVQRALVQLRDVEADLENTKMTRVISENMLASLVGTSASDFHVERQKEAPVVPSVPAGLPITLLQTRPDIKQADKLLEASSLDVGVAKTSYFPSVTAFLDWGYSSNKLNTLFKWKNHVWTAAAQALTPIYNAGKNASQVAAAIARYEEAVASYLNTVLTAVQEAESALASVEAKKAQLRYLDQEVDAAKAVFRITSTQYSMGLTDYLSVTIAEQSLLASEREQVLVVRDQYSSVVSLVKSLGGSWS